MFHEKLDFLMNLTDISNSKLAKEANIDPSLISRWRRGIKIPALHSDAVLCIAKAVAFRINDDFRKAKFAEICKLAPESLDDDKSIANEILKWFEQEQPASPKQTASLRRAPYPSYRERQFCPLDSTSVASAYCAGKDGRIEALEWIMSFVEHWSSGGTLRFYTDQSPEWLKIDHDYFKEVSRLNPRITELFSIVKILLPVNSSAANHWLILEFAKLFMENATVSINYVRQNERSIFQHSFGIYNYNVAITCFGFYAKAYLPTRLHSDEMFIHELASDFEANFDSAEIALRFVPRFTLWDLCRSFSSIFMQSANVFYRSPLVFLPFVPVEIMDNVLGDTDTSLDVSDFDYERLGEQLEAFLKQSLLIVSISFDSLRFQLKDNMYPWLFIQDDHKVHFNAEQCLTIFRNIIRLLECYENLVVQIEDEQIEDYLLVQDKLKLLYARINNHFIPYQSHHPHLVQVIWKKVLGDIPALLKNYDRAAVINKLREVIENFDI